MSEIEVYTVAVGNIPTFWFLNKRARKAVYLVKEQKGLIGIHRAYPNGTLLLFDTENNAKEARNVLRFKGVQCGTNICKVFVDDKSVQGRD